MNNIDFSQPGGYPLDQDTLDFLQKAYQNPFEGLGKAQGDVILAGVINFGGSLTPGWIVYGGEILPFIGGTSAPSFIIEDIPTNVVYGNGSVLPSIHTRRAVPSTAGGAIPFTSLTRLKTQAQLLAQVQGNSTDIGDHGTRLNTIEPELLSLSADWVVLDGNDVIPFVRLNGTSSFTLMSSPAVNKIQYRVRGNTIEMNATISIVAAMSGTNRTMEVLFPAPTTATGYSHSQVAEVEDINPVQNKVMLMARVTGTGVSAVTPGILVLSSNEMSLKFPTVIAKIT